MPHGHTAAGARANWSQVVLSSNESYFLLMDRALGSYGQHNVIFFVSCQMQNCKKMLGCPAHSLALHTASYGWHRDTGRSSRRRTHKISCGEFESVECWRAPA